MCCLLLFFSFGNFYVEPVWEAFCELYPHSGPAIWTDAEPCEDTRQWQFDASFMLTLEQTREAGS